MKLLAASRKYIPPLFITAGSVVIALLLIELFLRIFTPSAHIPQREYDPHLGWRGRSNLKCILAEQSFSISISQNSKGFRDKSRNSKGTWGVYRVLCTGDSFTWGWAVEQDAIYTSILEKRLLHEGYPVEIINTGVGGYSTDQVLLYLQREGFDYSPDIVVYQAAQNDITGNAQTVVEGLYHKPYFVLNDKGEPILEGYPVPPFTPLQRLRYCLSRHSRLAYFLKHRIHLSLFRGRGDAPGTGQVLRDRTEIDTEYPFRLFCALISKMHGECKARGVRLAVLIDFPFDPEQIKLWGRTCGGVDTHFLKAYLRSNEESYDTPAFIPKDGHWTESGHRWIADYLHDSLLVDLMQEKQPQKYRGRDIP
jgi:hypothetical protein